jgi:hypothetical protein
MNNSGRTWSMGLAAFLTLGVMIMWAPVDHGSAILVSQTTTELGDQHGHLNATDADCDGSTIGCCQMAHCCPCISVGPQVLPAVASGDATTPAPMVHGTGNNPQMVLPPPRSLPV